MAKFLGKLALLVVICGVAGLFRVESVDFILQPGGNASDDVSAMMELEM